MDKYKTFERIGEGSFGVVYRCKCLLTGKEVALKFIQKRNKDEKELHSLRRECEIQQNLYHPNIVRMIDSFETNLEVVVVSEYLPEQLFKLLERQGSLTEERTQEIACNLVSAIYYLHFKRILHRDIKPQNILLSERGEAKLCDFGFSRKMDINTYVLTSVKGTPLYMAPEVLNGKPYDHNTDLWALGCIIYECLTGKPPYFTNSILHLVQMVQLEPVQMPDFVSNECRSFLIGLLEKDSFRRLSWPHLLDHPWVEEGVYLTHQPSNCVPLTSPLTRSQEEIKAKQKIELCTQDYAKFMKAPPIKEVVKHVVNDPVVATNKNACFSYIGPKVVKKLSMLDINPNDVGEKNVNKQCMSISAAPDELCEITLKTTVVHADVHSEDIHHNKFFFLSDGNDNCYKGKNLKFQNNESTQETHANSNLKSSLCCQHQLKFPAETNPQKNVNSYSKNTPNTSPITSPECNINIEKKMTGVAYSNEKLEISDKVLENEEWIGFLDQSLADVLNGNIDIYLNSSELSLSISPLRNITASLSVINKIITLLKLPFSLDLKKETISDIIKVYLYSKVIPNIVLLISLMLKEDQSFLNVDKVDSLSESSFLLCHLMHYGISEFIVQFCDSVRTFDTADNLLMMFKLDVSDELLCNILTVITQVLRELPEHSSVIYDLLMKDESTGFLLSSLFNHDSANIQVHLCSFVGYLAYCFPSLMVSYENSFKFLCDLINLEGSIIPEVRKAASFAISCIQSFTDLMPED